MTTNHCWFQLLCIFLNFAAVVGTILVILSALGIHYGFGELIPGFLTNGTVAVDSLYPTPVTPSSWIHVIWLVVYVFMLAWSIHAVISVCRKFSGVPVYVSPSLVNTPILLLSISSCGMTVTWFCVYDREYVSTATIFVMCTTCLTWAAYSLSVYSLHVGMYKLEKGERMTEAWLHRILVQNSLALLGMWSFYVTILNMCTALIHNNDIGVDKDTSAVISLSVIAFYSILYVILDVTVLDRFTRYTCLQYLVPIVVLCACIFQRDTWPSDDVVFILLATLVAFSFLQIMLKAACVACRIMTQSGDISEGQSHGEDLPHYLSSTSSTGYAHEGRYLLKQ